MSAATAKWQLDTECSWLTVVLTNRTNKICWHVTAVLVIYNLVAPNYNCPWELSYSLLAQLPKYTLFAPHPPFPTPPKKFAQPLYLISLGYYSRPKRNWGQCLCKIFGSEQSVLWEMCKLRIRINPAVTLFDFSQRILLTRNLPLSGICRRRTPSFRLSWKAHC